MIDSSSFLYMFPVLLEASRQCGSEALCYLGVLKDKTSLKSADCIAVMNCLSRITVIGEVSPCMGMSMAWKYVTTRNRR